MENTYTMIALDGSQYGPVSLGQLKSWIVEGRVAATTKILRSDTKSWLPASDYAELELSPDSAPSPEPFTAAPVAPMRTVMIDPMAERRIRLSGQLFFWIAGFSLVNTFARKGFVIGLGITQLIDLLAIQMSLNPTAATAINVIVAGLFAFLGVFACKRHGWSFMLGMILYALDGLIFLRFSMWLGLAVHAYFLYRIFLGWKANRDSQAIR
jgi:hypothetical protein